jgi:type VI secretion system secreted protein Hcp
MAESISLTLTANGDDIEGDNLNTSLERQNTIEVLKFEQSMFVNIDRASLRPSGRRVYAPVKFSKRLDRSTVLLRQALNQNQVIAGNFRWFRPNPAGDGTTQHFFTLAFTGGRITRCELQLPDVLQAESSTLPPMELVELMFDGVTWTWEDGGIEHTDSISSRT